MEYLKNANAKLAVASSSPRWEVEKHLNDAGIIDCFSAIICGDMVEKSKPAPDIYIKACEMLNENPEECIALEDSKNGLLSAYRAGCKPIMVPDLWQPDEEILQIIKGKYSDLEQVKKAFESGEILRQGGITMNILVIGGTRFFGIHMVNELLTAGHDVTIATRGKASDSFGDKVDNGRFH